jgi:hypothetical protein
LNSLRLSRRLSFGLAGARIHPADLLLFRFGKVKIRLLQPLTPLTTLFVVSLFCQGGAPCSLPSKEFCSRHSRASDYSTIAMFIRFCPWQAQTTF